jgi:predicted permease
MSTSNLPQQGVLPRPVVPLVGIGGWLALFIFALFMTALIDFGQALNSNEGWLALLSGALATTAAMAAVQLFRVKKQGVTLAKIFLCSNVAVHLLAVLILYASTDGSQTATNSIVSCIKPVIWSGVWLAYLLNSKRVKNTYGL